MGNHAVFTSTLPDPYPISYCGYLELPGSLRDLCDLRRTLCDQAASSQQLASPEIHPWFGFLLYRSV